MKKKFLILFFLVTVFELYSDGLKSITINEIGERDTIWHSLIINTHALEQGIQLEGRRFFYCYAVDESTFNEIIDFINNNRELFGERRFNEEIGEYFYGHYGSVELFIENEGREHYLYLVERRSSAMFFFGLLELIINKGNYYELATRLEWSIRHFGFNNIISVTTTN
ncbi:MAG: hypothetical protein LBI28_13640 [Treponema sp.]|nr:hypothetical protein [Treponema sp.]